MTQHYDVAVIGGQLSGLLASALLAKRGRRVVLIDHGENTTYYRRKGLRLPLVPALVPALDSSPAMQKVHDELGIGPDLRTAARPLDPTFQAVLPHHRVGIRPDRTAMLAEIGAEFPELAGATARFFDSLFALDQEINGLLLATTPMTAPFGLRDRWASRGILAQSRHLDDPFEGRDLLAGIPEDHPLREVLLGPLAFFAHLYPDTPSTLHAVRLVARFYRGALSFHDRLGGLPAALLRAAEVSGVEVQRGAVVKAIDLSGRALRSLELDGQKLHVTADYFIANTLAPFHELLPPNKLQARYALAQRAVHAAGSLLTVNLVVARKVIPRGMAEAVFLLNGRRKPRGEHGVDPPLFVRRYPARRGAPGPVHGAEALDDPQHEVLSVACPVSIADVAHSAERLAALKQQIVERMGRLVPFLRQHLIDLSLPIDTTGWDVEAGDAVHRVDPWTLHPIFEPTPRPLLGVAARPTRTVFSNLVHCGQDVLPGLGLEGEYLTGLAAAATLQQIAGRNWQRAKA
jgi:phytoene dehydrogenase-like protein